MQAALSSLVAYLRKRTAEATDRRIGRIGEVLSGILSVKMLGWEIPLLKNITELRWKEYKWILTSGCLKGIMMANHITTHIAYVAMFVTVRPLCCALMALQHSFMGGKFNLPDIILVMTLVSGLAVSMGFFFLLSIQFGGELITTAKRLDSLFAREGIPNSSQTMSNKPKGTIQIKNGRFGWEKEDGSTRQTLSEIDVDIYPGQLVGIIGEVGSGKSSLLNAIMNETLDMSESPSELPSQRLTFSALLDIDVSGSMAFCSQLPWIYSGTVRENILCGNEFDVDLYDRVVDGSALGPDIQRWQCNDHEQLGTRGVNASGGQKARIALARAAYCQADINLLDDPLSAVDPRVANELFEKFNRFCRFLLALFLGVLARMV